MVIPDSAPDDAMEWLPWLLTLSGWAYAALVLACLLAALIRKREPASALGWSLAIVFLPALGVLGFLLLGNRRVNRRLARKILHHTAFGEVRDGLGEDSAAPAGGWQDLDDLLVELGQPPPRLGNRTELFDQGADAFEAMGVAIRAATHHVHVEFYIFRNDAVGQKLLDLLCDKARQGVQVRLLVDGLGSFGGRALGRRLRRAGGEVATFLSPIHGARFVSPNLRNHRKIVVCDGQVAFVGGLNVGCEYLGRRRNRGREWADLHARIEGPAVADLQWIFVEDWDYCTGVRLQDAAYFGGPAAPDGGVGVPVQIVAGGPDLTPNPLRQAILFALRRARRRVVIATPYLVPDLGLRDMMMVAARSGVEVVVLTQHPPPDHWLAFFCSLFYAEELAAAGVSVFGYQAGVMHAKALVVDGECAMIGTANLDNRSMFLNFEVMAICHDAGQAAQVETAVRRWLASSVPLDAAWIAQLPWYQRLLIRPSRLLSPLL